MSCGPFDLPVGREVPFSFCIVFGQNENDLINNAKFAQVMYNSRYQGFTPPTRPTVHAVTGQGYVDIYWDDIAEYSKDVVTGYSDFEGYKIYKSKDGGSTWGNAEDMIYDVDGVFAGWRPYQQFDLSRENDSLHCVYSNSYDCPKELRRGHAINGQDPYFPWFSLGNDTGLDIIRLPESDWFEIDGVIYKYRFRDNRDVIDGIEYTYSVVSYDMGVEPPYKVTYNSIGDGQYTTSVDTNFSNPDQWASPDGYASIENSKGTTVLDRNFVQVYPGVVPVTDLKNVRVVPNPYRVGSGFKEKEHLRQLRFTNLPEQCTIRIFSLTGESVTSFDHDNAVSGNAFWDMRSINNQEIAPGLYIFHVESEGLEPIVGKFAVIR